MTRKDYQLIADVLNERHLHLTDSKRRALANAFVDRPEAAHPNFDRKRFLAAIRYEAEA